MGEKERVRHLCSPVSALLARILAFLLHYLMNSQPSSCLSFLIWEKQCIFLQTATVLIYRRSFLPPPPPDFSASPLRVLIIFWRTAVYFNRANGANDVHAETLSQKYQCIVLFSPPPISNTDTLISPLLSLMWCLWLNAAQIETSLKRHFVLRSWFHRAFWINLTKFVKHRCSTA